LEQFKNVLILILIAATALSAALGHEVEAVAIAAILLFSVLLAFAQEFRAERAIEALRHMAAPTATALRDGEEVEIPARELVPGDVVLVRAGDRLTGAVRDRQCDRHASAGAAVETVGKKVRRQRGQDRADAEDKNEFAADIELFIGFFHFEFDLNQTVRRVIINYSV
ncbi:MAG: hypothetical protein HGB14_09255, partial [Anaerolineaceae bacterium]|nr:hypothetical protein [Anaerolineaceae bacterium]